MKWAVCQAKCSTATVAQPSVAEDFSRSTSSTETRISFTEISTLTELTVHHNKFYLKIQYKLLSTSLDIEMLCHSWNTSIK